MNGMIAKAWVLGCVRPKRFHRPVITLWYGFLHQRSALKSSATTVRR